jgi:hypothetical protein
MIPEPSLIQSLMPRSGLLSRLAMQIAASTLLTIFYTPGGVAGWTLELICRWYPGIARRLAPLRLVPIPVWDRRARRSVE